MSYHNTYLMDQQDCLMRPCNTRVFNSSLNPFNNGWQDNRLLRGETPASSTLQVQELLFDNI